MVTPVCGVGSTESAGAKWPFTNTRRETVQPGKAKGASCFAVTLALGVLISLFSAVFVTRRLLRAFVTERANHQVWAFGTD